MLVFTCVFIYCISIELTLLFLAYVFTFRLVGFICCRIIVSFVYSIMCFFYSFVSVLICILFIQSFICSRTCTHCSICFCIGLCIDLELHVKDHTLTPPQATHKVNSLGFNGISAGFPKKEKHFKSLTFHNAFFRKF